MFIFNKKKNIPTVSNLVAAGNPKYKKSTAHDDHTKSENPLKETTCLDEINTRIDEIDSAIGQDTEQPIGRAYAIRAEEALDS